MCNKTLNKRMLQDRGEENLAIGITEGEVGRKNIATFNRLCGYLKPVIEGRPLSIRERNILGACLYGLEQGLDLALLKDCEDVEVGRTLNQLVTVVTA